MTSVVDLWRAIDPEATLLSGSVARLERVVRGVMRTRVAPPHLPRPAESALLVADAGLLRPVDALLASLRRAELEPVAVLLAGVQRRDPAEGSDAPMPVLASALTVATLADAAAAYLADEAEWLDRAGRDLRLACAEATLAEPEIGTAAGLVAARLRRGVAVSADGELRSLHARPSGRALAARFTAVHARLLAGGQRQGGQRSTRDGLWLVERVVRPGASVWIFDDAPLAAVDEVAADALSLTLRALLRRVAAPPAEPPAEPPVRRAPRSTTAAADHPFAATLLAVARHNGRVLPAARELGVHRNTVLYRLRRARADTGLDPRRPEDALAILGLSRD